MSGEHNLNCGPVVVGFDGWQITIETKDGFVCIPVEADEAIKISDALRALALRVNPPRLCVVES